MGIYDRDYGRPQQQQYHSMGSGVRGIPPVVKWLLIINFAVYLIANLIPAIGEYLYYYGSVFPKTFVNSIQPWRIITYQFLHGGVMHLVFNLLVLYFMGPFVERSFGSRAFLKFYLRPKIILSYVKRIMQNPRNLSRILKGFVAFLKEIF